MDYSNEMPLWKAYIDDELSDELCTTVEQNLEQDSAYKEAFEEYRIEYAVAKSYWREQFLEGQKQQRDVPSGKRYGWAAATILLSTIAWLGYLKYQSMKDEAEQKMRKAQEMASKAVVFGGGSGKEQWYFPYGEGVNGWLFTKNAEKHKWDFPINNPISRLLMATINEPSTDVPDDYSILFASIKDYEPNNGSGAEDEDPDAGEVVKQLYTFYKDKKYDLVIRRTKEMPQAHQFNKMAVFLRALSLYKTGQMTNIPKAQALFEQLRNSPEVDSELKRKAKWNLVVIMARNVQNVEKLCEIYRNNIGNDMKYYSSEGAGYIQLIENFQKFTKTKWPNSECFTKVSE